MQKPFLSVVIANYNCGKYLDDAINSVVAQNMEDDVELIVCDAASTDNSVEVIKRHERHIAWWCSEKDNGQSAAFNKGFAHATGMFLTWLNADDVYLPGALVAVKKAVEGCPEAEWATGNLVRFNQHTGKIIEAAWGPHWVPFCFQGKGFPPSVFGPTAFWKRETYAKIGPLNEHFHYTMDSDYWRRLTMSGCKYVRINHDCWAFRMHEESKTAEFGSHSRTAARKAIMHKETLASLKNSGYCERRYCRLFKYFLRFCDGSIIRAIWRRYFLVGRDIQSVYKIKLKIGETK